MSTPISLRMYAKAYVQSVPDNVNPVREIELIRNALMGLLQVISFIKDNSINPKDRKEALNNISKGVSEKTINFILILAEQGRIHELERISELVREEQSNINQVLYADVVSSVPLTNEESAQLISTLNKKFNKDIRIESSIDKQILGGLCIRIGEWVYDASLKGRIERLKQSFSL